MLKRLGLGEEHIWRKLLIESVETHPECFVTSVEKMRAIPLSWFACEIEKQFVIVSDAQDAFAVLELNDDFARFHSMYVQPQARRKGLAGKIINHICDIAKNKGFERIQLGVLQDNFRAVNLYEKHGFRVTVTKPHGDRIDCEMIKDLTAVPLPM